MADDGRSRTLALLGEECLSYRSGNEMNALRIIRVCIGQGRGRRLSEEELAKLREQFRKDPSICLEAERPPLGRVPLLRSWSLSASCHYDNGHCKGGR